jgi:hypothetical protein
MHSIRLRGPWQFELSRETTSREGKAKLPVDLLTLLTDDECADDSTSMILQRYFNLPTGLSNSDQVHLSIGGLTEGFSVALNSEPLPVEASENLTYVLDVTSKLQPRNELIVTITPKSSTEINMEVALQIG